MNKEYKDRYLQREKEGYKISDEKLKKAYKQQKEDREKLLNAIGRVVLTYSILDGVLEVNFKQRRILKKKFNKNINDIISGQNKTEKEVIEDILTTVTKEKYYKNGYLISMGERIKFKKFSDKKINEIINSTIDGKRRSNRLWKNKKEIEKKLKKEIRKLFDGETSVNDIKKLVENKFNQNDFNTKRLVETEVSRCQNQANEYFAEEHEVGKQMFIATLDDRTTEFCQEHDSRTYKTNDPDKPYLPAHPFCRSCYIPVVEDWEPTIRKDNKNKEYIDFMSYEEWKEII